MHNTQGSGNKQTAHGPHTAKVRRSRDATPETANPNQDDVFLPKHAPIHIDPKTHEHFQLKKDGSRVVEEEIYLGNSVHFGDDGIAKKRSFSPQFSESTPSDKNDCMPTPVIGKASQDLQQAPVEYGTPSKPIQPINQQFPDDPCP